MKFNPGVLNKNLTTQKYTETNKPDNVGVDLKDRP